MTTKSSTIVVNLWHWLSPVVGKSRFSVATRTVVSSARYKASAIRLHLMQLTICSHTFLAGVSTISPDSRTTAHSLLPQLVHSTYKLDISSDASIWASQKPTRQHSAPLPTPQASSSKHRTLPQTRSQTEIHGLMELDDDPSMTHPPVVDQVTLLHQQFIDFLRPTLATCAYQAAEHERAGRAKNGLDKPQTSTAKSLGTSASMHAPKALAASSAPGRSSRSEFVMPAQQDVALWTCADSIRFLLDYPPDTAKGRTSTWSKLDLFLRGERESGGRRGRNWSRGDWLQALRELDEVAQYCGLPGVRNAVEVCRAQLTQLLA